MKFYHEVYFVMKLFMSLLTLLHGATQYTMHKKGSPITTPSTTKNLIDVVCCLNPGRFSYQIESSCCWQLGCATNCLAQKNGIDQHSGFKQNWKISFI